MAVYENVHALIQLLQIQVYVYCYNTGQTHRHTDTQTGKYTDRQADR